MQKDHDTTDLYSRLCRLADLIFKALLPGAQYHVLLKIEKYKPS